MHREQAHLADRLGDAVAAVLADEVVLQPCIRDVGNDGRGIHPGPGSVDRARIDVGGENLHRNGYGQAVPVFLQKDRERISFLAGRASRHPDPHRVGHVAIGQQFRNDGGFQRLEHVGIAEEPGHADQQFAEQQIGLMRGGAQPIDIVLHTGSLQHVHPALNSPHQRAVLVLAEVAAKLGVQHGADHRQVGRQILADAIRAAIVVENASVVFVVDQRCRHVLDPQHVIDEAGRGSALRHAAFGVVIEFGLA